MMRRTCKLLGAALLVASVAACGSQENAAVNLPKLLADAAKQTVQRNRGGKPPKVVVTPQMLAATKIAALQVNPEQTGGSDFLKRAATRRDSYPGRVEIWNSSDNAQIFLRNGVVTGTRGVGGDIIAADAAMTVLALQNRRANAGIRRYELSDGDTTSTEVQFTCEIDVVGTETITVVNQSFNTTHMRETCIAIAPGEPVITNDYWVQSGGETVRKSRQWVGPRSGYFELILLKE